MIALVLALQVIGDPCADLDERADAYVAEGQHDGEIGIRTLLVNSPEMEIADWYNLAVALLDANYPAEGWLYEVAARTPPWDPVLPLALDMLALDADPYEAVILAAHATALRELANGQAQAATQGTPQDPP